TFVADDVLALQLEMQSPGNWTFLPGQFVQFKIGPVYRAYSITSSPTDVPRLSFLIELVDGGIASEHIRNLKVGDSVTFRGALGLFFPKETDSHHVYIATGVGIAPFLPIIKYLSEKDHQQVVLLFGGRVLQRLWFQDQFQAIAASSKLQYFETLTKPEESWQGLRGRVTEHLPDIYKDHKDAVFHV